MNEPDFKRLKRTASSTKFEPKTKVDKKTSTDKSAFIPGENARNSNIPYRLTPRWVTDKEVRISNKKEFDLLSQGRVPVGILPEGTLLSSEEERKKIVKYLSSISAAKYDNTDADQKVESWGKPLVDSPTIEEHLSMKVHDQILAISDPLVEKIRIYLEELGYQVGFIVDPDTGVPYHAGVLRQISVSKSSSVLHVDDFIRDGQMKPDFRLPHILKDRMYYQVSFNLLIEDGGYQADPLFTYNRFYNTNDERYCFDNGWQFPVELVQDVPVCQYQPKVGEAYVFSTTAYHDIYGGSPKANRITWSVFAIYIPSLNQMLLYN